MTRKLAVTTLLMHIRFLCLQEGDHIASYTQPNNSIQRHWTTIQHVGKLDDLKVSHKFWEAKSCVLSAVGKSEHVVEDTSTELYFSQLAARLPRDLVPIIPAFNFRWKFPFWDYFNPKKPYLGVYKAFRRPKGSGLMLAWSPKASNLVQNWRFEHSQGAERGKRLGEMWSWVFWSA